MKLHVSGPKHRCLTWNHTEEDHPGKRGIVGGVGATKTTPQYVNVPGIPYKIAQYAPTVYGGVVARYQPGLDCKGYFMSSTFMTNNNCYNYACNIASNSNAQPGRKHGYTFTTAVVHPGTGEFENTSCRTIGWIGRGRYDDGRCEETFPIRSQGTLCGGSTCAGRSHGNDHQCGNCNTILWIYCWERM